MEEDIEKRIMNILEKGHEYLGEEISDKLNIPEDEVTKYLNQMAKENKIKTGMTEDIPYTTTYRLK
jgi:Mn-dependent DtxR family transcriptional regulator